MQLALDSVDRLVELVEERGPVDVGAAARDIFRLRSAPEALARTLVTDLVAGDARLSWHGPRIADALRTLPDRQRDVLVLRFYLDLPESEIARTLGIGAGTVKTHTRRGLDALAAQLESRR